MLVAAEVVVAVTHLQVLILVVQVDLVVVELVELQVKEEMMVQQTSVAVAVEVVLILEKLEQPVDLV
jgi:hypothetical protein